MPKWERASVAPQCFRTSTLAGKTFLSCVLAALAVSGCGLRNPGNLLTTTILEDHATTENLEIPFLTAALSRLASQETLAQRRTVDPRPIWTVDGPIIPDESHVLPTDSASMQAKTLLILGFGFESAPAFPLPEDCAGRRSPPEARTGCPEVTETRMVFGLPEYDEVSDRWVLPQVRISLGPIGMIMGMEGLIMESQGVDWEVSGVAYSIIFE